MDVYENPRSSKERNRVECEVLWDNGERSWEPVQVLRKDDPITMAKYADEHGLSNQKRVGNGQEALPRIPRSFYG